MLTEYHSRPNLLARLRKKRPKIYNKVAKDNSEATLLCELTRTIVDEGMGATIKVEREGNKITGYSAAVCGKIGGEKFASHGRTYVDALLTAYLDELEGVEKVI